MEIRRDVTEINRFFIFNKIYYYKHYKVEKALRILFNQYLKNILRTKIINY